MSDYRFLVMADCLWDTRLATVAYFDSDYAAKLLLSGYATRKSDRFKRGSKKFSAEFYDQKYAARDWDTTIRNSTQTRLYDYIHELIVDEIRQQVLPAEMQKFVLHLNVWPYELDQEWRMEVIEIIRTMIPLLHDVDVVSIPIQELTPKKISASQYTATFIYDLEEWFNYHVDAIAEIRMPQHYVIVPDLLADEKWEKKIDKKQLDSLEGWSAKDLLEYVSTEFLPIRFIEPAWYSSIFAEA